MSLSLGKNALQWGQKACLLRSLGGQGARAQIVAPMSIKADQIPIAKSVEKHTLS